LIGREALIKSGNSKPTPSQKILKPFVVPVDSTNGVGVLIFFKSCTRANSSETAARKGEIVDEPTM